MCSATASFGVEARALISCLCTGSHRTHASGDDVATAVAAFGHDSVAVDQRGQGLSSQVDDGFDFATLAADLDAVIDATLGRPVIAVGQSWGANVVLELAAQYPNSVLALVDGGFARFSEAFPSWE
jgi:pimeloyl-ACP methyl ester carboxylesterase